MDMNAKTIVHEVLGELTARYPRLDSVRATIADGAELMIERLRAGNKMLICGNGGSAADADHIVGELAKAFTVDRPLPEELARALVETSPDIGSVLAGTLQAGIPAIALTHHTALSTAFANDVDPGAVFAQQVNVLGDRGDLLWAISTSGNSTSVVYAAVTARAKGLTVVGLTGASGGRLARFCDVCIRVPESETYKVQELHLPIYHQMCIIIERYFFSP